MKKKVAYILISILFVFTTGFVILNVKKQKAESDPRFSELLPRNSEGSQSEEWNLVKLKAAALLKDLQDKPDDKKSLLALTSLYVNEGRITGNLAYYNSAAMNCTEKVLKNDPENFEALTFKSMILLSQHRFEAGLEVAQRIQAGNPYNAFVYGLMVDANVELGNYQAAVEAADKMVSIRPDLRSYSRVAYLREIHGDLPGAIEAMKLAIDAGAPGDENTEWCRVQLGKLYEQLGQLKAAAMQYTIAGNNRPDYPYAMAGLGRIAVEGKNYEKALSLFKKAVSLLPDHTFKEAIAEIYTLMGEEEKANRLADEILEQMKQSTSEDKVQNEDHEMAHAYMGVNNYGKALDYALQEYKRRPSNIEVNETVAIVYYQKADYAKAIPYIEAALKTNCQKPELLCHAGLIYAGFGDKAKAKYYLDKALKNDPVFSIRLRSEAASVLKTL
jgi:tetratricopeptide (TPR) repeat protein